MITITHLEKKSIKEPIFWRNYFYRCSLAQQALQLEGGDAKRFVRNEDDKEERGANATAVDAKTQVEDLKVNDAAAVSLPVRTVMSSNGTDASVDPIGDPGTVCFPSRLIRNICEEGTLTGWIFQFGK